MTDMTGPYCYQEGSGHPEVAEYLKLTAAIGPGLEPAPLLKEPLDPQPLSQSWINIVFVMAFQRNKTNRVCVYVCVCMCKCVCAYKFILRNWLIQLWEMASPKSAA